MILSLPSAARAVPSPAPRAVPSPAPRAVPSPAPRAVPSPAPRAVPSPAPCVAWILLVFNFWFGCRMRADAARARPADPPGPARRPPRRGAGGRTSPDAGESKTHQSGPAQGPGSNALQSGLRAIDADPAPERAVRAGGAASAASPENASPPRRGDLVARLAPRRHVVAHGGPGGVVAGRHAAESRERGRARLGVGGARLRPAIRVHPDGVAELPGEARRGGRRRRLVAARPAGAPGAGRASPRPTGRRRGRRPRPRRAGARGISGCRNSPRYAGSPSAAAALRGIRPKCSPGTAAPRPGAKRARAASPARSLSCPARRSRTRSLPRARTRSRGTPAVPRPLPRRARRGPAGLRHGGPRDA